MTVQELALRMAKFIGVTSLDPNAAGNLRNTPALAPGDLDDIAAAINGAMQEIFASGPAFICQRRYSDVLRAPVTLTLLIAAQYSKTMVFAGYESWMLGCTCQIDGDPQQNEIVSPTSLLRPHMGSTGTSNVTVWADALALPSYVSGVIGPIEMPLQPNLRPVTDRLQLRAYNQVYHGLSDNKPYNYATTNKQTGIPGVYLVDSFYQEDSVTIPIFMRFNPMPSRPYPVTMQISVKPPTITAADITTDNGATDPTTLLPLDWHESVLLPVCIQRFSAHPAFKGPSSPAEMMRQHRQALQQLEALRPQIGREQAIYK